MMFEPHLLCTQKVISLPLHLEKYILIAPDLSKASIVKRLQRQSSFVLPRKKNPTSNQLTLQRPVYRGTNYKNLETSNV
jgi:hypothetical protein